MGYVSTNEKGDCFKNGKCTNKLGVSEVDFDNEIANLPDTAIVSSYHLYNGKFDNKDCWYNGDASHGNICDVSDDLEEVQFHIAESKNYSSQFDNSFNGYLLFEDSDLSQNTYNSITIELDGKSTIQLDNDSFVDYRLDIFKQNAKLSDKKNKDRQNNFQMIEEKKRGFISGSVPKTPYDEKADNAPWFVDNTKVEILGEYRKDSNGE